ncbi:MAG: hypothetical protein ACJ8DQ_03025 [Xanthobacteraceae bacterium]
MSARPKRKRSENTARSRQRRFDPNRAVTADAALSAQIKTQARLGLSPMPPVSAAAAAQIAAAVKPGKERWPVKTGQDGGAAKVGQAVGSTRQVIVDATVEELVDMARPRDMRNVTTDPKAFRSRRAAPVELTIWRITAHVTAVKNEDDGDLHLALQGESGETMIAESVKPDATFVGKGNPWLPAMRRVRAAIQGELRSALSGVTLVLASDGKFVPPDSFESSRLAQAASGPRMDAADALDAGLAFKARITPRKARLTGVGFFDRVHGQLGVAPKNGIELHPLLGFEWLEGRQ